MEEQAFKKLLKEVVYTDLADLFLVVKLEERVKDNLKELEAIKDKLDDDLYWQDYVDYIAMTRACLKVLEWYSVEDYSDYLVQVNKYSLKLEEVF